VCSFLARRTSVKLATAVVVVVLIGGAFYLAADQVKPLPPRPADATGHTQQQVDEKIAAATKPFLDELAQKRKAANQTNSIQTAPSPSYIGNFSLTDDDDPRSVQPISLSAKMNVDASALGVFVEWQDTGGTTRVHIADITGRTKNEKISLPVVTATDVDNPNGPTLFWGDVQEKPFLPMRPEIIIPIPACLIVQGPEGSQKLPFKLLRISHVKGPMPAVISQRDSFGVPACP